MDLSSLVRMLGGLGVVLGILGGALWLVRRFDLRLPGRVTGTRTKRLELVETLSIDGRRVVALVRRDGHEHLVLIAPEGHMMLEQGIIPAADQLVADRDVPRQSASVVEPVKAPGGFAALVDMAVANDATGADASEVPPIATDQSPTRSWRGAATWVARSILAGSTRAGRGLIRLITGGVSGMRRAVVKVAKVTGKLALMIGRAAGRTAYGARALAVRAVQARARAKTIAAARRTGRIAAAAAAKAAAAATASAMAIEAAKAAAVAAEQADAFARHQSSAHVFAASAPVPDIYLTRPRPPARLAVASEPAGQQPKRNRARRRRRARQETYVA